MSNELPASTPGATPAPLIEPTPAAPAQTNPWKVATFVVGGAGIALAVITGLSGMVVGSAMDGHGAFGPGGRDGGFSAGAPGWGDHGRDSRHRGDRDGSRGFDDNDGPGMMGGRGFDRMPGQDDQAPQDQAPQDAVPQSQAPSQQG